MCTVGDCGSLTHHPGLPMCWGRTCLPPSAHRGREAVPSPTIAPLPPRRCMRTMPGVPLMCGPSCAPCRACCWCVDPHAHHAGRAARVWTLMLLCAEGPLRALRVLGPHPRRRACSARAGHCQWQRALPRRRAGIARVHGGRCCHECRAAVGGPCAVLTTADKHAAGARHCGAGTTTRAPAGANASVPRLVGSCKSYTWGWHHQQCSSDPPTSSACTPGWLARRWSCAQHAPAPGAHPPLPCGMGSLKAARCNEHCVQGGLAPADWVVGSLMNVLTWARRPHPWSLSTCASSTWRRSMSTQRTCGWCAGRRQLCGESSSWRCGLCRSGREDTRLPSCPPCHGCRCCPLTACRSRVVLSTPVLWCLHPKPFMLPWAGWAGPWACLQDAQGLAGRVHGPARARGLRKDDQGRGGGGASGCARARGASEATRWQPGVGHSL
jgi:hypothetical protein